MIEPPQRYKSTVTLLRVTRKLRPEMKEHLLRLNKAMPDIFKLEDIAYYENEVRFRENEREYIAPLQKELVPFLLVETKKKKIIEIYYYFVGMIEDDPVLLINEFQVK